MPLMNGSPPADPVREQARLSRLPAPPNGRGLRTCPDREARRCFRNLFAFAILVTLLSAAHPARGQTTFTVVLDAAHGGPDPGALLTPQLPEKAWTLGLSVRLRSALQARGFRVLTTRESDTDPAFDARASDANHARAGACLVLHATGSGSGAHLYTSSLNPAPAGAGELQPWTTAQAPFLTRSLQLASELNTAFNAANIPVTLGRVRLPPLDSLRCPAVAVELAPLHDLRDGKRQEAALDDPAYEQRILDALSAALIAWRAERAQGGEAAK